MADDKGWAGAVPELYFDLIGRIPPGLFFSLVLLFLFASDSPWFKSDVSKIEWGPSLIAFILLVMASYSIGMLISPVGKYINRNTWDTGWKDTGSKEISLLKEVQQDLKLSFRIDDVEDWEKLEPEQRKLVYYHIHELLKVNLPEAKLILPRLAAELTFFLNFFIAIPLAFIFLSLYWAFLHWPVCQNDAWRSPTTYLTLFIFLLAFLFSLYGAKEKTQHYLKNHYAFLAIYLHSRASLPTQECKKP